MKKTLSILLLTMLLLVCVLPVFSVGASAEAWDGTTTEAPDVGDGSKEDPYLIANAKHLAWLSAQVAAGESFQGKYFLQTADIDLSGQLFTPIGPKQAESEADRLAFAGHYDGDNHTISNAVIHTQTSEGEATPSNFYSFTTMMESGYRPGGLFGVLDAGASVSNLRASNVQVGTLNISATSAGNAYDLLVAGVIAGTTYGDASISNCITDASCVAYASYAAGGIIGMPVNGGTVTRCSNSATVSADQATGGIVGFGYNTDVSYCINYGNVSHFTFTRWSGVGGIMGAPLNHPQNTDCSISYCMNYRMNMVGAQVSSTSKQPSGSGSNRVAIGGIIGNDNRSPITNMTYSHCYNLQSGFGSAYYDNGNSSASTLTAIGGIAGYVKDHSDETTGTRTFEHCYSVAFNYTDHVYGPLNRYAGNYNAQAGSFNSSIYSGLISAALSDAQVTSGIGDIATSFATCEYGVSKETIQADEGYQAISEKIHIPRVDWSYNEETGELTISGDGEMELITSQSSTPWEAHASAIQSVTIEEGVKSIGSSAFEDCTSLTSITIPDSVTSIGNAAFDGCTSLASITIPDSVTIIGSYAFYGCTSLASITIPDSVTSIDWFAFSHCTNLTSITIPDSVTIIGSYAFYGCTSLASITIPDSVTIIDSHAFAKCTSLANVTIGNGVEWIGNAAFYACTSLESITIGTGVTNIESNAFEDCPNLKSVYITDVAAWCKISFNQFGQASYYATPLGYGANLYLNNVLVTELEIPDTVTSIHDYAFRGCTSLTSVTIPEGVHYIGNSAFSDCKRLQSITLPDSLTDIGSNAFYACISLTQVQLSCKQDWGSLDSNGSAISMGQLVWRHAWDEGEETASPTHLTFGSKLYTCLDCGETRTEEIAKLPEHTYGEEQFHNGTQHKQECACGDVIYIDHAWDEGTTLLQPTQTTEGLKHFTCVECGTTKLESLDKLPAHVHSFDEGVILTNPSETTEGVKVYTCACGETKLEKIDKLPAHVHSFDEGVILTNPSEETEGVKVYTCACGETKLEKIDKLPAHVHSFDEGKILTNPSETTEGVKVYTCACGETKLEKIDKLPAHVHSFDEGVILTNPSETTEGVKVYTCACGETKLEKIDKLPAHTHTFDDGEILTNPSELTEGVKVYTCACGETKLEKIDKLPAHVHSFDEGKILTNPSETTEGVKVYTCACGEIKLEKIDKLPAHVHSFDEGVILTNPSETTEGVKVYTCACGEVKLEKIDKLPAHTHTFDDGEILTNPSELTEGVKVYTCACGETKLEKIDKLPAHVHSFDEGVVVVNPTHLTEGAKIYTCTCGVTRAETIAKTAEHTHGDWENHNDTQHKKVCACGDTVYEDHTLADGACGVCGKQSASGCAASVSGIALILPLCGAACLMLRKKKKQ